MKIFRENILYSSKILVIKEEYFPINEFPLHNHPEYELISIISGTGNRYVGDNIAEFAEGDLCFFGPDLPHTYCNKHLQKDRDIHQIVIHFDEQFLGKGFFDKSPFKLIKAFFERSIRGYSFHGRTRELVNAKIRSMLHLDETALIIELLSILHILSTCKAGQFLSSSGFSQSAERDESERMERVIEYMLKKFQEEITLPEIASIACLSPEAFCRYFKKYTRKTFSEYLVEVRIGHACKLLQENRINVNQISFESGFNNVSYFNRKFKAITKKTPVEYHRCFQHTYSIDVRETVMN